MFAHINKAFNQLYDYVDFLTPRSIPNSQVL